MKTRGLVLIVAVIVLMSGCTAPVFGLTPKPIDTLTNTTGTQVLIPVTRKTEVVPTATFTPTETVVPTSTLTITPTPEPTNTPTPEIAYTELGKEANKAAELLGWTITLCDTQADKDANFLYSTGPDKYFCDFEGHMPEPVQEVHPQYLLVLSLNKGLAPLYPDGVGLIISWVERTYYASPSTYDRYEFIKIVEHGKFTVSDFLVLSQYMLHLRAWPLTKEEYDILKSGGFTIHGSLY